MIPRKSKTSLFKIRAQVTYLYAFDEHSQIQSKDVTVGRFSENSPLVIDYNVCVIDYTVIFLE